jgi:hypothetical protein
MRDTKTNNLYVSKVFPLNSQGVPIKFFNVFLKRFPTRTQFIPYVLPKIDPSYIQTIKWLQREAL